MNKNTERSQKLSFTNGIGSSSILVIFVILCLVSFATLSIASANADYKLSQKLLERTTAYYTASNQAEASLAHLDKTLLSIYESSASKEEYFQTVGYNKSFIIPITENQNLKVIVSIEYPETDGELFYRIQSWQVITAEQPAYDKGLNLIDSLF